MPDQYTTFECPLCNAVITTALPAVEVSHLCPKKLNTPVYLKGKPTQ